MVTMIRNTTTRDRHRKLIARDQPPCHLCNEPIDYQAHHLDPSSFTIDHITPLSRGGSDTLDNLAAAHRRCNNAKYNATVHIPVIFETERAWV